MSGLIRSLILKPEVGPETRKGRLTSRASDLLRFLQQKENRTHDNLTGTS